MDENKRPKERIIFDEDVYDEDFLRERLEELYVDTGDMAELNNEFVNENWYRLDDYRQTDFDEEMDALKAYFEGKPSDRASEVSEHGGNPIIVSGSIGRWDGTRSGFSVYKSFEDVIDMSPSWHAGDNVFADCEIQKVWDQNGSLYVHGSHHDGSVTVEVRQLSGAGADAYEAISDAWVGEPFEAGEKTYDGSERSVIEAMRDLWEATEPPRYMERAFGCPAKEWEAPENPAPGLDLYVGHWRVHLIRPAERLGLGMAENTEYDLHPGRFAGEGMVQFYDMTRADSQRPAGEMVGQFGLGSLVIPSKDDGLSALERCAEGDGLTLYPRDLSEANQHVTGAELRAVEAWARGTYERLGGKLPERRPEKSPERSVSLKDAAQESRASADARTAGRDTDVPARAEMDM